MLHWKTAFRQAFVHNRTPGQVILLVLVAHFLCCTGVWDIVISDHVSHNETEKPHSNHIETPLHDVDWEMVVQTLRGRLATANNDSQTNATNSTNHTEEDGFYARLLSQDPLSMIGQIIEKINEPRVPPPTDQTGEGPRKLLMSILNQVDQMAASCSVEQPPEHASQIETEKSYTILHDTFVMHGIAGFSFVALWMPSVYWRGKNMGMTFQFAACTISCVSVAFLVDVFLTKVIHYAAPMHPPIHY